MTIPFLMDLLLAGLLVAMIVHGAMLNRRLARLREDRDGLAAVVRDFQAATGQAVAGLDGIRVAADATGRTLQERVDAARAAIRDLEFLVERGERAADRLEGGARPAPAARPAPLGPAPLGPAPARSAPVGPARGIPAPAGPAGPAAPAPGADQRSSLLKAIEGMR
ncbi:MAG: DUF6468 domain-containing protein [Alphaproteobacteria bacterium]